MGPYCSVRWEYMGPYCPVRYTSPYCAVRWEYTGFMSDQVTTDRQYLCWFSTICAQALPFAGCTYLKLNQEQKLLNYIKKYYSTLLKLPSDPLKDIALLSAGSAGTVGPTGRYGQQNQYTTQQARRLETFATNTNIYTQSFKLLFNKRCSQETHREIYARAGTK